MVIWAGDVKNNYALLILRSLFFERCPNNQFASIIVLRGPSKFRKFVKFAMF